MVKQDVGGVPQDVRRLSALVFERAVESVIGRGGGRSNRDNRWAVISALFSGMFDGPHYRVARKRGYLSWEQRDEGEAIIAAVNALIGRQGTRQF